MASRLEQTMSTDVDRPRFSATSRIGLVPLAWKGLGLLAAFIIVELVILAILFNLSIESEEELKAEAKVRTIIGKTETLIRLCMEEVPAALEGYMFDPSETARKQHGKSYLEAREQIPRDIAWLHEAVTDPAEKELLDDLAQKTKEGLKITDAAKEMADELGKPSMPALDVASRKLEPIMNATAEDLRTLARNQQGRIEDEKFKRQLQLRTTERQVLIFAFIFNVAAAIGFVILFLVEIALRLGLIMDNTKKLAKGEALNPVLSGTDEIAELDRVFHEMAANLAEAARKERLTFEQASDIICSLDSDLCFSRVNPSSFDLFGLKPEELIGAPFLDLIYNEDREEIASILSALLGSQESSDVGFEARMKTSGILSSGVYYAGQGVGTILRDHSFLHMLWSVRWLREENSLFCIGHDITDRKRVEELIKAREKFVRQLIELMPVGLVRAKLSGEIEFANPSFEKMVGYEHDELVGEPLTIVLDGSSGLQFEDLRSSALNKLIETTIFSKDGSRVPVDFSVESFDSEAGGRDLAIFVDATQRSEVRKIRNQFVAMITHELRTPLTSILGYLGLLVEGVYGEIPDSATTGANKAKNAVDRLVNLINDLLDLEKLEAGQMDMSLVPTDIATIVEKSIESVSVLAENKEVRITWDETDLEAIADEGRLVQVLVNLLSNAVKYSPQGETIRVGVSSDDGFIKLSVKDKGQGVPAEFLETIFERFQQARGHKEGTGLGLAICKAIIDGHGGRIGVESTAGSGSTFWFTVRAA